MSLMPPPPLREPLLDANNTVNPVWALWFEKVTQLIKELSA